MPVKSKFAISRQPDDITCGPTCLYSIYQHYGYPFDLSKVIDEIPQLRGGGTLGPWLGVHALRQGFKVSLFTYNLNIFDPTWSLLNRNDLVGKLARQIETKKKVKIQIASGAYMDFLKAGGEIKFADLSVNLLMEYLLKGIPLITGLSASYLYRSMREYGKYPVPDDIRGVPQGHFVVLTGCDPAQNVIFVADPYHPESMTSGRTYKITVEHLICSILLGVVTYDGNLIVITKG
jgi:hypothetical protein